MESVTFPTREVVVAICPCVTATKQTAAQAKNNRGIGFVQANLNYSSAGWNEAQGLAE
jgi:hypothetical protein